MKKLKNIFLSFIFLIICLGLFGDIVPKFYSKSSYAEETTYEMSNSDNPLKYVTIINDGVKIDAKATKPNEFTATVNGSVTINLNPFDVKYSSISIDNEKDFIQNVLTFTITPISSSDNNSFIGSFNYKNQTINIKHVGKSTQNSEEIYSFNDSIQNNNTSAITVSKLDNGKIQITVIDSYTLKQDVNSGTFKFQPKEMPTMKLILNRPVYKFANGQNEFLKFEWFDYNVETKDYDSDFDSLLPPEQTFNKLKLTFLNDIFGKLDYTYDENNPLYFNINFNGFTYSFKMYFETIEEEKYLFVKYIDSVIYKKEELTEIYELATDYIQSEILDNDTQEIKDSYIKFNEKVLASEQFSLTFTHRGRYELEFYDNTYKENLINPDLFRNPNYYKTSFYLKTKADIQDDDNNDEQIVDAEDEEALKIKEEALKKKKEEQLKKICDSKFDDIYILAQTINEETNEPIEYIVDSSIQNTSVKIILKNMIDVSEKNYDVKLEDIIEKVEITITEFDNPNNIVSDIKTYYPEDNVQEVFDKYKDDFINKYDLKTDDEIQQFKLKLKLIKNEFLKEDDNYTFTFSDDSKYTVTIYSKNNKSKKIVYQFAIIKNIKVSFKPEGYPDASASKEFITESGEYEKLISNNDPLQFDINFDDRKPKYVVDVSSNENLSNLPFFIGAIIKSNDELNNIKTNLYNNKNNLTYLKIEDKENSIDDLDFLENYKELEILDIEGTKISSLKFLLKLPNLKVLRLYENDSINDYSFIYSRELYKNFTKLEHLEIVTKKIDIPELNNKLTDLDEENKIIITNSLVNSTDYDHDIEYYSYIEAFNIGNEAIKTIELDIKYNNTYIVKYGKASSKITPSFDEKRTTIFFTFQGVGNMTATIDNGHEKLTYTFIAEGDGYVISFTEYAKYVIDTVDEMGNTQHLEINFAKKLNTSSLILIGVSIFLVLAISAFIVIVRGRAKTR